MPYNPRPYQLIQPPPLPDAMQTLSGLMSMTRQMAAAGEESKERKRVQRIETAMQSAKGDLEAAAGILEKDHGDWISGRTLRNQATEERRRVTEERRQAVDGVMNRLGQQKNIFGQGAQLLENVTQRPELYPDLRPTLVDLASALDPRLAAEIPEQYDPEKVTGMLQFVNGGLVETEVRARGLASLKAGLESTKDTVEQTTSFRRALGDWLSTAKSAEDWDGVKEHGASIGIPRIVLDEFGDWSDTSAERARQMALPPAQRTPDADEPPTFGSKEDLYQSYANEFLRGLPVARMSATQKTAAEKWWHQRTAADKPDNGQMTSASRAAAERWKFNQLKALEDAFAASRQDESSVAGLSPEAQAILAAIGRGDQRTPMTEADLTRRKLDIENTYRRQIGVEPVAQLPAEWNAGQPPPGPAPARFQMAPPAGDGSVLVTAPDGTRVRFPDQKSAKDAIAEARRQSAGR